MVAADSGKNHRLVRGCLKLRKPWPSLMVSKCVLRNHPGIQATEEPPRLLGEVGKINRQVFSHPPSSHQGVSLKKKKINYCPFSHFNFWKSLLLLQSKQNKAKINQTTNPYSNKNLPLPSDPLAITSWYRRRNKQAQRRKDENKARTWIQSFWPFAQCWSHHIEKVMYVLLKNIAVALISERQL